ncbi:hypothetical protein J5J01_00230 [Streptomyces fradiae]|uniref:hypothetical protein n=1 Tax=Streptomyces fradiae TaxID=1906 RepID=UPI002019C8FA|nr:hypothetical protein [Streptomyces fradiae]UQS30277.1 hypothetical protein J5J01_00230 [Streptomyces fradiae]
MALHEIGLLLSYIMSGQGKGPLGVECSALLSSFDVLPGKLSGVYAKTGVRPDLLYDLAAGPVAGGARAATARQEMFPPGKGTPEQRKRLEKLAQWSVDHGDHAYFMSWVWLGAGGVYVDVFLPYGSAALTGLKTGWIDVPGGAKPWQFRASRPDPRRVVNMAQQHGHMVDLPQPEISGEGAASREVISRVGPKAEEAMDRAFSREEHQLGTLHGVPVRGRWIRGDILGEARHEVLLGVLGERIEVNRRAQRERLATLASDRLDTFLDGRRLTAVRPVDGPHRAGAGSARSCWSRPEARTSHVAGGPTEMREQRR